MNNKPIEDEGRNEGSGEMNERLKKLLQQAGIYVVVAAMAIFLYKYVIDLQTKYYVEQYKTTGCSKVIQDIADTYKTTIELYSNYKLSKPMKQNIMNKLNVLNNELHKADMNMNKKSIENRVDFSYIYHDLKLVNLSLSDVTKDDVVPVVVLHAMEGLGELKKELTYIQYR